MHPNGAFFDPKDDSSVDDCESFLMKICVTEMSPPWRNHTQLQEKVTTP